MLRLKGICVGGVFMFKRYEFYFKFIFGGRYYINFFYIFNNYFKSLKWWFKIVWDIRW